LRWTVSVCISLLVRSFTSSSTFLCLIPFQILSLNFFLSHTFSPSASWFPSTSRRLVTPPSARRLWFWQVSDHLLKSALCLQGGIAFSSHATMFLHIPCTIVSTLNPHSINPPFLLVPSISTYFHNNFFNISSCFPHVFLLHSTCILCSSLPIAECAASRSAGLRLLSSSRQGIPSFQSTLLSMSKRKLSGSTPTEVS